MENHEEHPNWDGLEFEIAMSVVGSRPSFIQVLVIAFIAAPVVLFGMVWLTGR